jgi:hypothetical protein
MAGFAHTATRSGLTIPSALVLAVLGTACHEESAGPPACTTTPPPNFVCLEDGGCTQRWTVVYDGGQSSVVELERACPADTACDFGSFADAEVTGACPTPGGLCANVTTPEGVALRVDCRDTPDANAICYRITQYFADGGTTAYAANC